MQLNTLTDTFYFPLMSLQNMSYNHQLINRELKSQGIEVTECSFKLVNPALLGEMFKELKMVVRYPEGLDIDEVMSAMNKKRIQKLQFRRNPQACSANGYRGGAERIRKEGAEL